MQDPAAEGPYTVVGEYLEVRRPERLAYTWSWEGDPPEQEGSADTIVSVDFLDDGERTIVVVTHTGFAGPGIAVQHEHGWGACLVHLADVLS